jgi:phosphatidylinositol glycan class B
MDYVGECSDQPLMRLSDLTRGDAKEWKHGLRSSIHPLIFAGIYYLAGSVAWLLHLSPLTAADLLIAAPKTTQAIIAAIGDYYTWKLAGRVYGSDSYGAWATVRSKIRLT